MKTLTLSIIALASLVLSAVHALESGTENTGAVQLPAGEQTVLALAEGTTLGGGECKAVCSLPVSFE